MNEGIKVLEDKLVFLDKSIENLESQVKNTKRTWESCKGHLEDYKQKRAEVDVALMKLKMHEGGD